MPSSATGYSEQEYKFGHVTYPITVKRFLCVTWRAKQDDAHIPLVHQHTRGRNSVTIDSIEGTHIYMYQLESFPRKNADRLKKDRRRPNRPATRCTAAVFYPAWRITGVHHKKGQPSAATSHEARPGKPSFAFSAIARATLVGVKQITRTLQGLASSWDSILNTSTRCYTTTRCTIEPASKRRPRHQRRHKTLQRHKRRHGSRSRAAGKQTAAKRGAPGQAREPETTTLYQFALGTGTAHRPSLRQTMLRPMLQRKGYSTTMG